MAGLDLADPELEAAEKPLEWLGVEFWPDGEFKPEEQFPRQPFGWAQQGDHRRPVEIGPDGTYPIAAGPASQQVSPSRVLLSNASTSPQPTEGCCF